VPGESDRGRRRWAVGAVTLDVSVDQRSGRLRQHIYLSDAEQQLERG